MKKKWIWHTDPFPCITKTCRIMRLSLFFLTLMTVQGWALDTYSQVTRLSLDVKDTRVIDVLQEIEQKTEFYFLFNQKLVDVERRIDMEIQNKPIEEVLSELFAGTNVNYLVMNRQIVLTTARPEALKPQQQPVVLTGKVNDTSGSALPGVAVTIKGTTTGTVTNAEGIFSLANVSSEATLVFSFVGMKTLEIVAGNRTTINVVMEEELFGVDEVVVVGYGIQKKKLVTGATLQVKGESIEKLNSSSVLGALQSQSPGVYITQSSGQVGEGYNINIRGLGTTGNSTPLYVIDGVAGGSLNSLNPSDIESIDILKDAASAAIYGARAANGVVLVTTKRGKAGKLKATYDAYYGIQNPMTNGVTTLNGKQYMEIINKVLLTQDPSGSLLYKWEEELPAALLASINNGTWEGTNWLEEGTNKNAPITSHAVNLTGGSEQ